MAIHGVHQEFVAGAVGYLEGTALQDGVHLLQVGQHLVAQFAVVFIDVAAFSGIADDAVADIAYLVADSFFQAAVQVHLVHLDGHSAVEHFAAEREGGLVHIHRTHHEEVLRDGQALAALIGLVGFALLRRVKQLVYQAAVGIGVLIFDDGVGGDGAVGVQFAALDDRQVFGEVLLHWGEVHLVEAEEVRHLRIFDGCCHEAQEGANHELLAVQMRHIAYQLAAVVPVGLHLHHTEVPRVVLTIFRVVLLPTSFRQLSHNTALSRPRDSRQQHKRLRPQGGEVWIILWL